MTFPLTYQQLKSSRAMQELQPKLREIQKQYAKDKEKQMQEQMRLYKEHGVNPALGCVPMLIQMPIWFALYRALYELPQLYPDFAQPFLWITNLAQPEALLAWPPMGWPILTLFTGISQWALQKMMTPHSDDPQQQMMNSMMQFMPLMFVFFAFQVPAGLVLYWATSNLFSLVQQYFMTGWGSLLPARQTLATAATGAGMTARASSAIGSGADAQVASGNPGNGRDAGGDSGEASERSRRRRGRKKK
ncbi:MAG: YidC/Oxa1 family membrane protein insertase [Chloroflexi bacterium]|nr:YidC/Oxa1 family membrane protein insertase [Chloroflexota bacterium]